MLVVAVPTDPQMDAFSLVMVAGAVYTVVVLARRGRSFWTDSLRGDDRQLAVQVAFFLLTPPTVFLHELAHAAATVALGGTVVQFHYVGFSGYVRPAGFFGVEDVWLLAVSGSVASLAVAVSFLLVGGYVRALPVTARYVLVMGGGLQAAFTLGGYPLWSILGRFGDWMAIYDFEATPGLSAITLGAHALTIAAVVVWWRRSLKPRLTAWEGGGIARDGAAAVATGGPDTAARVTTAADAARVALVLLQEGDYGRAEALALRWLSNRSDSASSGSDVASDRSHRSHGASNDSHDASTHSQSDHSDRASDRSDRASDRSDSASSRSDSASSRSDRVSDHSHRASGRSDSASGHSDDESGRSDDESGRSDDESGRSDSASTHSQSDHSDSATGRSDSASGHSDDESGRSDDESGRSRDVSSRSVSGVLLFVLGAAQLPRMKYGKAAEYFEQAAATTDDEALRQRALANLMLAFTQDHRAGEALVVYKRLRPEWRTNPGVQKALDVIQVRTGKRPPAV